jgi:hypothetical protein
MPVTLAAAALLATGRSHESGTRPSILIAEDNGVIGMMLNEDLSEAGFEVSGPFTTCGAALASLEGQPPMRPFWT